MEKQIHIDSFEKHYPDLHGIIVSWIGKDYEIYDYEFRKAIAEEHQKLIDLKNSSSKFEIDFAKEKWVLKRRGAYRKDILYVLNTPEKDKFIYIDIEGAFSAYVFNKRKYVNR